MSPFVRLPFCAAKGQQKGSEKINYRVSVFNLCLSIYSVGSAQHVCIPEIEPVLSAEN